MELTINDKAEFERLNELKKYNILDTLTEKDYDDITFLASQIYKVPIALISFVDKDRQWFKSHPGIDVSETPREYSFCAHALKKPDEPMIITDAKGDTRFANNPLVTGDPNIVFYAGFPLVDNAGYGLGTLCVIDRVQRELSELEIKALQILSTQVMNLLELRRKNFEFQVLKMQLETRNNDLEQFSMVVAHDIKSPLATISLVNDIMKADYSDQLGEEVMTLISKSAGATNKIKDFVDGILSFHKGNANENVEEIVLQDFFKEININIPSPKPYSIYFDVGNAVIKLNKILLEQIFFNLITNSIRYNDKPAAAININFSEDEAFYKFTFADNGIGIPKENQGMIFDLFTTVSNADSFGKKGHGIGLATVKKIIENYQGQIEVQSEEKTGTTFTFTIKKI